MITNRAKYALKALTILARNPRQMMPAQKIAEEGCIPLKFLETILAELKNRKIVSSRRGPSGGYLLAQKPEDVTAGDIIRMMDGPIAPLLCASLTGYRRCEDCEDEDLCAVRKMMMDSRKALSAVLDRRTLKDLAGFGATSKK
ncbi:MAG: Rrf2 family transcriptional regulator [Alphaproteobacteria bacterium]|nr:Rrf2 family transcriptional regulator [Alphaproteobacteria bacterium]MBP7759796.1 Rrf2 family transcriptional regulator [Alphaproteobacteria bacterium]MBP7763118.1 Rrf2 family transcriptional regulator [Alphaproteobacteria bacterium]MBP7906000.1 Rrf2 family transcriptional regulator [Alphaproteobacteria bacterium]